MFVTMFIARRSALMTLLWRHNEPDCVSNHQPHDCLLNRLSGTDQRKHQSSTSLAFVWGIHRGPVNSPHKWPVTRKMFPFDDVIMRKRNDFLAVTNMALNKPAWQHGTNHGGEASRAVDGNDDSDGGSCTHTKEHTYPTWGVDLQIMAIVYYVEIMRRYYKGHGTWMGIFPVYVQKRRILKIYWKQYMY